MTSELVPCPHCGADIRSDARFCRDCGSSDSDGWSDRGYDDADDSFDYDEFVRDQFPEHTYTNANTKPLWRFVAAILLLLFFLGFTLL